MPRFFPFRRIHQLALALGVLLVLAAIGIYTYWPEDYLRTARLALERKDNEAARGALARHLESRPDSDEAHLLFAQMERQANNFSEALKHLDACSRYGEYRDALELERGLIALQNGLYNPELDRLCQKYLARHDGNECAILEAMSQGFIKSYRLKEAFICLQRLLALQPDCSFALRTRAWICSQSGQTDQAEKDYRLAVQTDPSDVAARLGLAQILLDIRKDPQEAAQQFERIWTTRKDSVTIMGLAKSWRTLGRNEEVRVLLDDWLKGNPGDPLALMERGKLALDEREPAKAIQFLRQAVALSPYLLDANQALFLCLSEQGLTKEADECQARLKQARKDSEQLAALSQKLQANPNNPDLRCQMAEIFLRQREDEEGVRWLVANLQSHPNHRASHLALAEYYERIGQTALAGEHRRLAGTGW